MGQATRDEQVRARLREYESRLVAARELVAVLARFVQAREARGSGNALEVAFAATPVEPDGPALPAAVWVALRHDDVDAVLDTLVHHASEQFLIAEHEQLDASYRLTAVAECRGLPDTELLIAQLAVFIQVPRDVLTMVSGWGPEDPRTVAEIERLMDQRYQPSRTAAVSSPTSAHATSAHSAPVDPSRSPRRAVSGAASRPTLAMSSREFAAVLALTPEQQAVLATLVRQADIVVSADTRAAVPD